MVYSAERCNSRAPFSASINVYFRNKVYSKCVANMLIGTSSCKVFRNESKHFRKKYMWFILLQSKRSLSCFNQGEKTGFCLPFYSTFTDIRFNLQKIFCMKRFYFDPTRVSLVGILAYLECNSQRYSVVWF